MLHLLGIVLLSFLLGNSLILMFNGKGNSKLNKGIGLTLFLNGLVFLSFLLSFDVGLLREYPFLLRVVSPIFFLISPIFYLSIRNIVQNTKTKKIDFIHFLPAILHFLELIPLYTLSNQEKLEIIEKFFPDVFAFILNVHGLIPTLWVNLAYLTVLILYFSLTLGLVLRLPIELRDKLKQEKFKSILFTTLAFYFVFNIIIILSSISIVQFYFTGLDLVVLKGLLLKSSLVFLFAYNFYFFYKIELTTDSKNIEVIENGQEEYGSNSIITDPRSSPGWSEIGLDRKEIISKVNQLIEKEQLFLTEGLLINDFAKKAGIPLRVFPDVLNLIFQKNFKELILERRVHYAKEKIEQGYLDKLTLESLRIECGFGSRTAFYYAFKKEFELSPFEYWKEFQRNSDSIE